MSAQQLQRKCIHRGQSQVLLGLPDVHETLRTVSVHGQLPGSGKNHQHSLKRFQRNIAQGSRYLCNNGHPFPSHWVHNHFSAEIGLAWNHLSTCCDLLHPFSNLVRKILFQNVGRSECLQGWEDQTLYGNHRRDQVHQTLWVGNGLQKNHPNPEEGRVKKLHVVELCEKHWVCIRSFICLHSGNSMFPCSTLHGLRIALNSS